MTIQDKIKEILKEYAIFMHGESCGRNYYGVKEWTCRCGAESEVETDTKRILELFHEESKAYLMELKEKAFDLVEECNPDCTPEEHAYHKGTWDSYLKVEKWAKDKLNK